MRKFLLTLCVSVVAFFTLGAQPTIYAYRYWQKSNSENTQIGPVKFLAGNPAKVTLIANQSNLGRVYAATYYNYKWYAQVTQTGTQSQLEGLYTIDLENGKRTRVGTVGTQLTEMTVDYTNGTVYGIKSGAAYLMTINLSNGATNQVGAFKSGSESLHMLALACDTTGKLYGISTNDSLYTIDKSNAECTIVGATGVNAAFTQSMDFDRNTGVLYWANNGDYKLYTINTSTGAATLIGPIGENGDDSLAGLSIPYIKAPVGAPDRVTNRKATAQGNAIKLSWTNPQITAQGDKLKELTAVKIYRNDSLVKTINLDNNKIGQSMEWIDDRLPDGHYTYKIVPSNTKGNGGVDDDDINIYIGSNPPGAVVNFKVTAGDNSAILTWGAPEQGMYGGQYDPSSITKYVITRSSGRNSASIEITDPTTNSFTDNPGFGTYIYSIYAVNDKGNGTSTTAPSVMVKPADWIIMTTGKTTVESGKTYKFYDPAGPNAYYPNSRNDTLTISPLNPDGLVHVEFSKFATDTYGDFLYIYNGPTVKSPLIGKFSSSSVTAELESIESTSSEGSLTFVFTTDVMGRDEGWEATVTVTDKKQHDLVARALEGDLYPSAQSAASYQLPVYNKGIERVKADEYTVSLLDAAGKELAQVPGVDLTSMQIDTIHFSFTPTTAGDVKLYARINYDRDQDLVSNYSDTISVRVLDVGSTIINIGDHDKNIVVVPASFMSAQSLSETIYYREEIGLDNGQLSMIIYKLRSVGTQYTNIPVKIWVGETDSTHLEAGTIPASELNLVFDGLKELGTKDSEWTFQFSSPYTYTGRNLVILLQKGNPGSTSYDVNFEGTYGSAATDEKRTRFTSSNDIDTELDPNTNFGYSASTIWPDIKLVLKAINTSVANPSKNDIEVSTYPNPVLNSLYVKGDNLKVAKLYNMSGRLIVTLANPVSIDMSSCAAGVYFLRVTDYNGKSAVRKIIKK